MSEKKFQQANLSHNINCQDIVSEINRLVKKIKIGRANSNDINLCKKLTNYLQQFINKFTDIDDIDKWIANETISMSKFECDKYDRRVINDKI